VHSALLKAADTTCLPGALTPQPTKQQFAFNTLQRVSPVSHGVCNVVKRVVIIFSSVLFFNQVCCVADRTLLPNSLPLLFAHTSRQTLS
jgi:hypothetical protein